MDESRPKRPLADDPSFLASLSDLDRGLTTDPEGEAPKDAPKPAAPASGPQVRRVIRRVRRVISVPAPAGAPTAAPPAASSAAVAPVPTRSVETTPAPPAQRTVRSTSPAGPVRRPALPASPAAPAAEPPVVDWSPSANRSSSSPSTSQPYKAFYGLTESPFTLSTDPVFLFHSTAHDRTAQAVLTSIRTRPGVVVITGPVGIGKTTLCRAVVEQLDRRTLTSFFIDPFVSVDDLLETLLIDFGALSREDLAAGKHPATTQLRSTLESFLGSLSSLQASAVVLVDEAQNLPVPVLDELRALAEKRDGRRLLHVVLVGEPGLPSLLKRTDLRKLNEQVAVRSALGPLMAEEMSGYVTHRLSVAGSTRVEFSQAALARVHHLTGGVPRAVNVLCNAAMSKGYEASAGVIDIAHVDAAAGDLDLSAPVAEISPTFRLLVQAGAFVLLMLLGAAGALWVFRDDVRRTVVQWERVPPIPPAPRIPMTEPLRVPSMPNSSP